jgi:hypothetical protein
MRTPDPTNGNASHEQQLGEASNLTHSAVIMQDLFATVKEFPNAETVKGRVLGALLHGEKLTQKEAWFRFGSATLTQAVYALKRSGWTIRTDPVTVKTTDAGRPAIIGVYYLDPDTIAAAGEYGQQYADQARRIETERKSVGRGGAYGKA